MERIQKITLHTAEKWFNGGREFYIVPAYANGKLSEGDLVDKSYKIKFDDFDKFLYDYRGKIPYYKDKDRRVEFFNFY